ncbi:MAG: Hpt domain-containing protein [Defluviitaleaceae bacterium]|nr:Hpt domain-containing protein [Defluviitaleaceae bacterium]
MYVDEQSALSRLGGNKKLYYTLLKSFKNDNQIDILKEKMSTGDIQQSILSSHSIKGIAANLSLMNLYEESSMLEIKLKDNQIDMDALDNLKTILDATINEIDRLLAAAE